MRQTWERGRKTSMKLEPVRTLEPVAVVNSVVALAEALIGVAVGFGAPLSKAARTRLAGLDICSP